MIPRTPTKGKFCIIAEGPVNVGLGALQMSVAKMKGKRATATLLLAFGQLQNSVAEARGCFLPDRSAHPPFGRVVAASDKCRAHPRQSASCRRPGNQTFKSRLTPRNARAGLGAPLRLRACPTAELEFINL